MKIAVSFLSSNDYQECIQKINSSTADYLHVDMCDGKYVATSNFVLNKLIKLLSLSTRPLDIHLMTMNPEKYIEALAYLNVDTFTFHLNSNKDPMNTIKLVKSMGLKVGIALNPDEDIDLIMPYLKDLDQVLIMSVVPGKGGQPFMPEVLNKITKLNELKDDFHFITAIDGGIKAETMELIKPYYIDKIISGSYITNNETDDYNLYINELKKLSKN